MNSPKEADGIVNGVDKLRPCGDKGHIKGFSILKTRKDLLTRDSENFDGKTSKTEPRDGLDVQPRNFENQAGSANLGAHVPGIGDCVTLICFESSRKSACYLSEKSHGVGSKFWGFESFRCTNVKSRNIPIPLLNLTNAT